MGPMNADYGQMSAWLDHQQRRIAELEAENRDLRRQLDELRRGVGVTVMIQGQVVPLAPVAPPSPANGPGHVPADRLSQPPAPGSHMPAAQQMPGRIEEPIPAAFAEDAWLTGSMRAVKASPRPERVQPRQMPPPARPQTPSQEVTPLWLREEAPPAAPARPREPSTWDEILAAQAGRPWPSNPQPHTYQRAAVRSRPLNPRLEPVPFPTLAQATGQHRAVRPSAAQRQQAGDSQGRTPYSDSFVLG